MHSRMERYYQSTEPEETEPTKRSRLNEDLYNKIYDDVEYSNIEGIAQIEKTNEIDISRIKEMLKNRESYRKEREFSQIVKRPEPIVEEAPQVEEDKNYDIRDIMTKAKDERSDEYDHHSLKNTQYNILKGINLKDHIDNYIGESDENLKELINTITNTSLLNKLGDRDLSLNLLNDLKSNGDTMYSNTDPIRKMIESAKEEEITEASNIDKSFYTSSLGFAEKDFEEFKDMHTTLKKNNLLIRILIFILAVITTTAVIFTVFMYLR